MLMLTHTIIGGKKKMKNTMHNLTNRGVCDIISSKYLIHTYKKDRSDNMTIRADGRFQAQIDYGYDEFGKRKRKTIYGKTKRELEKKVREFKNKIDNGELSTEKPITFKQMADMWIENYTSNLNPMTVKRYKSILNKQLVPLYNCKLNKITTNTIQSLLNSLAEQGYGATIKLTKSVLGIIFKKAVACNYISVNPVRESTLPKYETKKRRALTPIELQAINNAEELTLTEKTYLYIGLYAGLRQGEILALAPSDIDFDRSVISVNKTLTYPVNQATIQFHTKTKSSMRNVPITEPLVTVLRNYINTNPNNDYLFLQKDNSPYSKTAKRNLWSQILKKINYHMPDNTETDITSHYLRHNYATELYRAGIQVKEAQYLLGHSNLKTTLDIYTELDKENINILPLMEYWKDRK